MIDDVESKEGRCRCPLYNMVVCGTYLLESTVQVQDMEYNLVNAKERVLGFPKECNALTY